MTHPSRLPDSSPDELHGDWKPSDTPRSRMSLVRPSSPYAPSPEPAPIPLCSAKLPLRLPLITRPLPDPACMAACAVVPCGCWLVGWWLIGCRMTPKAGRRMPCMQDNVCRQCSYARAAPALVVTKQAEPQRDDCCRTPAAAAPQHAHKSHATPNWAVLVLALRKPPWHIQHNTYVDISHDAHLARHARCAQRCHVVKVVVACPASTLPHQCPAAPLGLRLTRAPHHL